MKIAVVLEVDEELVKKVSGKDDLEDAITTELGWLQGSGMQLKSWEHVGKEQEKEASGGLNTKISYLYRDADNYKTHNKCVIKGVLTEEQQKKILECLHEGEWFIPHQVGLDENRNWDIDLQVDHPWFELDEYAFSETSEVPTVNIDAEELVAAFEKAKGNWDEFSWLNGLDIEDELEEDFEEDINGSGSLEDKILEAKGRQGDVSGKVQQKAKDEISL